MDVFEAIYNEATLGIILVDQTGHIIRTNPYLNKLFGYQEKELEGQALEILIPSRYKKKHVDHRNGYLERPKPRTMGTHDELYGIKKDGSTFSVTISLSHSIQNGEKFAIGFVSDDSVRKKMIKDLLDSQARLEETQSLANIGSFKILIPSREVILSTEAKRIFGFNEESQKSFPLFDLQEMIVDEDRTAIIDSLERLIAQQLSQNINFRIKAKGSGIKFLTGRREVLLNKNNEVVGVQGFIQDISSLKEYEEDLKIKVKELEEVKSELNVMNTELEKKVFNRTEELEESINQLLQMNRKLEEQELMLTNSLSKEKELSELKSRFVSMASHEFRTPLSTILSSSNLLKRYTSTDEQVKREKHIGRIKSSVTNLTGILNDFLSVSKIEEGKITLSKEKFDLKEFCENLEEEVQGLLKNHQSIEKKMDTSLKFISTDKRILHNVLLNLLSNAIKYSTDESVVRCNIFDKEDHLVFEIIDQGIGIPKEDQKHLFSRFYRASNVENIQGTGLGLNIVKKYCELINGSISFTSEENKGSNFSVAFKKEDLKEEA